MKPKAFNYTSYTDLEADMVIARAEIEQLRKELEWKDMVIELAERTAQAPHWIPVEERPPEMGVSVLGWCKDNPFAKFRPEIVAWNGKGWVFVYAQRYVTDVTHWMPLPEPPNERS